VQQGENRLLDRRIVELPSGLSVLDLVGRPTPRSARACGWAVWSRSATRCATGSCPWSNAGRDSARLCGGSRRYKWDCGAACRDRHGQRYLPAILRAGQRTSAQGGPGLRSPVTSRSNCANQRDKTQELLRLHTVRNDGKPSGATSSPLIGKLFDDQGERLTPRPI